MKITIKDSRIFLKFRFKKKNRIESYLSRWYRILLFSKKPFPRNPANDIEKVFRRTKLVFMKRVYILFYINILYTSRGSINEDDE